MTENPPPDGRANLPAPTVAVYAYLCAFNAQRGFSPSLRQIAAACFMSTGAVFHHLDRLEAWGYIARQPGQARSITLLKPCPLPEGG